MEQREYNEKAETAYITKQQTTVDQDGIKYIETNVFKRVYGAKQFYKLYLFDLLNALGMFSNSRQLDVFLHMLANMESSTNQFIGTYKKICEETGASWGTVQQAITALIKADIIRRVQQGVYLINPNLVVKGGVPKHARLTMEYEVLAKEARKRELPGQVGFYDDQMVDEAQKNAI